MLISSIHHNSFLINNNNNNPKTCNYKQIVYFSFIIESTFNITNRRKTRPVGGVRKWAVQIIIEISRGFPVAVG